MAFNTDNIQRVTASLNLGTQWAYVTTDTLATVLASSYFDQWSQELTVNDLIFVQASDQNATLVVTAINATTFVTTTARYTNGSLITTKSAFAGGGVSTTITVTGAATGDNVIVGLDTAVNIVALKATVSGSNTVTVTFASDPGACTLNAQVVKAA